MAAIAAALPKVPQNGTVPSSAASAASSPIRRATSVACPAIACWSCTTSFGPPVVPEVVKVRQGVWPVASSGPASAAGPSSDNTGRPASCVTLGETLSPSTQRSAARSCAGRAAKIAGKSTGGNPHSVSTATGRDRRRRFPTSARRKRVLMWMASAPSRAQAKIAAREPAPLGSHSATRAPGPTPALRRPAATHNTRFWKARRSSVPAESVTAGPDGSRSDHAINAPSVRGYSGPYVFRIRTDPHRPATALRTFWQAFFIADIRQALARAACPQPAALLEPPPTALTPKPSINGRRVTVGHRSRPYVTRLLTAMARRGLHTMLTLGQAARLGTITMTGPAVRHATPDVTDAELRYRASRVQESLTELKSGLEEMRSQRDAWEAR